MPGRKRKAASIEVPDVPKSPKRANRKAEKSKPSNVSSTCSFTLQLSQPPQPPKRITRSWTMNETKAVQNLESTVKSSVSGKSEDTQKAKPTMSSKTAQKDLRTAKPATCIAVPKKPTNTSWPITYQLRSDTIVKSARANTKRKASEVEEAEEPKLAKRLTTRKKDADNIDANSQINAPGSKRPQKGANKAEAKGRPYEPKIKKSTKVMQAPKPPIATKHKKTQDPTQRVFPAPFVPPVKTNPVVKSEPLQTIFKEDKSLDELSKRIAKEDKSLDELSKRIAKEGSRGRLRRPAWREEVDDVVEPTKVTRTGPNFANDFINRLSPEDLKQTILHLAQDPYLKFKVEKRLLEKAAQTETCTKEQDIRNAVLKNAAGYNSTLGLGDFGQELKNQLFWVHEKRKIGHFDTAWMTLLSIASYTGKKYDEHNDTFYDTIDYLMLDICVAQEEAQSGCNVNVGRWRALRQAVGDEPPFDHYGRTLTYLEYIEGIETGPVDNYEDPRLTQSAEGVLRGFYSQDMPCNKVTGNEQTRRKNRTRPHVYMFPIPEPWRRREYRDSHIRQN